MIANTQGGMVLNAAERDRDGSGIERERVCVKSSPPDCYCLLRGAICPMRPGKSLDPDSLPARALVFDTHAREASENRLAGREWRCCCCPMMPGRDYFMVFFNPRPNGSKKKYNFSKRIE